MVLSVVDCKLRWKLAPKVYTYKLNCRSSQHAIIYGWVQKEKKPTLLSIFRRLISLESASETMGLGKALLAVFTCCH
jgi:hypothetical protein